MKSRSNKKHSEGIHVADVQALIQEFRNPHSARSSQQGVLSQQLSGRNLKSRVRGLESSSDRNLKELQSLSVAYNALAVLPDALGALGKLKTLNVSHNQLAALPESIAPPEPAVRSILAA